MSGLGGGKHSDRLGSDKGYLSSARLNFNLRPCPIVFWLGNHHTELKGIMILSIPVRAKGFIALDCHVFRAHVPMMRGFDVL